MLSKSEMKTNFIKHRKEYNDGQEKNSVENIFRHRFLTICNKELSGWFILLCQACRACFLEGKLVGIHLVVGN